MTVLSVMQCLHIQASEGQIPHTAVDLVTYDFDLHLGQLCD
jgi:hypothetical protein